MKKKRLWLLWTLAAVLLAAAAAVTAWYFLYRKPFLQAENAMPQNLPMTLTARQDGTYLLEWPEGINADCYTVELLPAVEDDGDEEPAVPLFTATLDEGRSCVLPAFPEEACTLRVVSGKRYRIPGKELIRVGAQCLELTQVFAPPTVNSLEWTADADTGTVQVRMELDEQEQCVLFLDTGDTTDRRELTQGAATYTFGDDREFPLPELSRNHLFSGVVCRTTPGLIFFSAQTELFQLPRESLLGTVLRLNCQENGNNIFTLSWNETKGERYLLQMQPQGDADWQNLCWVDKAGQRRFTTAHLAPYTGYQFRVLAVGGEPLPDSEFAATPGEASVFTGASPIYATIWPIQKLEVYSGPDGMDAIGWVAEAGAYCVLEEVGDWFRIRYENGFGYIDSRYCMINLPEYMGDLCAYAITNSDSSLYMVHEYEIPEVTDTVIKGYEHVLLYDGSRLTPLLYPSAKKLEQAALAAMDQGLKLRIYDSYRPRAATQSIYDLTAAILDDPIPELTFAEKVELEKAGLLPPEPEPTVPEPTEPEGETGVPQEPEQTRQTYRQLMTDGRYSLGNFLAYSSSYHNMGIAMDLTLVAPDGKDLKMQTAMHDLSWYSEVGKDNDNAKKLDKLMKDAGFGGLRSEWWHFQDDEARIQLGLKNYMYKGVSPACWMADDTGWRYRKADGRFYTDCTREIDGVNYSFDEAGYATVVR